MLTPEERGPTAWWAFDTRERLGLTVETVAETMLSKPKNPGSLRKAESRSANMSQPLWRELTTLYPRLARERGVAIATPPSGPGGRRDADASLASAIERQADAINELAAQVKALVERPVDDALPGLIAQAVALAVRDTLRAAGVEATPQQS